jgi:hypothetical protein
MQDQSMRALALAGLLALSPLSVAIAEEIPGSQYSSGYWSGAGHTDDRGAFSHCAVSVGFTNGETLWFGVYPDDTISILLSHPQVKFQPGQQFDILMMMETGVPWEGVGEAWDRDFAGITFQEIDTTGAFLTSGQWFRMLGIGIDEAYDVTGLADALALATNCLAQNSGSNPFGTTKPKTPLPPKVPDLKPKTGGIGAGGGLGTRPGGALGTPAPKPQP